MRPDNKKNYTESFKNIVISLGVIIGGLWTVYVFSAKLEVQNAKAELKRINQQLMARPVIVPSISTSILNSELNNTWYIITNITLENKGNMDASIGFEEDSLIIAKVEFDKGTVVAYHDYIRNSIHFIFPKEYVNSEKNYSQPWVAEEGFVLSGQKKTFQFISKINKTGIYRVQFMGILGSSVKEVRKKVEEKRKGVDVITISDYILVANTSNKTN